jgi:hypothetical protein
VRKIDKMMLNNENVYNLSETNRSNDRKSETKCKSPDLSNI